MPTPKSRMFGSRNMTTWDVIDEAKNHFKSALNRIQAERGIQKYKQQNCKHYDREEINDSLNDVITRCKKCGLIISSTKEPKD